MRRAAVPLSACLLILAACAGATPATPTATAGASPTSNASPSSPASPTAPATQTPTPPPATATPSATATPTAGAQRIDVMLTEMRIEPAAMVVTAGQPVTFVVTNTGVAEHEFFLGDESAQAEHEAEMAAMGGMLHDEPNGIGVAPGQTKELTFVFPTAGEWLAGCHVAGHYGAGMWATITINP